MEPRIIRESYKLASALLLSALFAACKPSADANRDSVAATSPSDTGGTMSAGAMLTDAQIANIVMTVNSLDSAAGAAAMSKAKRADVRDFGRQMTLDHAVLNDSVRALTMRLNVTPAASDVADQMRRDAEASTSALSSAADYDKAYIDGEITMHRNVLRMIDESLIPHAVNGELKTLLQTARVSVAAHLQRAEQVAGTAP